MCVWVIVYNILAASGRHGTRNVDYNGLNGIEKQRYLLTAVPSMRNTEESQRNSATYHY